jgi:tRNA-dihydrouridine synthase
MLVEDPETALSPTSQRWDRDWLVKLVNNNPSHPHQQDPRLRDKILATAPMIEQSDTAFRLLTRRYGANLCFTPMIHARTFLVKKPDQQKMFDLNSSPAEKHQDCPLIAQIAGSHKDVLLQATKLLEPHVDAIDLNLGCPTKTAKRGGYKVFCYPAGST